MGFFFGRKKALSDYERSQQALGYFSQYFASGRISPAMVYDATTLEYPKEFIFRALKIQLLISRTEEEISMWGVVAVCIAQFQDGVGPTPLGLDIARMQKLPEDLRMEYLQHTKHPDERLTERIRVDEAEVLRICEQARQKIRA